MEHTTISAESAFNGEPGTSRGSARRLAERQAAIFNPVTHPILLARPQRYTAPHVAWAGHVPMAMLLMDLLQPATFVELGTHRGLSYCAFCQAVAALAIDCDCYAVDTWEGDPHATLYDESILEELRAYHDPLYSSFSHLLQMTFDEACPRFADGSVDLLHIDGYHTYDAVKHDFETWLPKMSRRGVVIMHDTAEHQTDFGVWRFWGELEERFAAHMQFTHSHGLGVVAVGDEIPPDMSDLLRLQGPARATFRALVQELGQQIIDREAVVSLGRELENTHEQMSQLEAAHEAAQQEQQEQIARLQTERDELTTHHDADRRELADRNAEVEEQRNLLEREHGAVEELSARATHLEMQLADARSQLTFLESSRGVRLVKLARASRAVLRDEGPGRLGKRIAQWMMGIRGRHLHNTEME